MPTLPTLPAHAALLIDFDGTLVDIAPTPSAVVVPAGLPASLRGLRLRLGDALAVVTGRPIEQVDALLGDLPYAVAGEHGGAIRHAPTVAIERADLTSPPAEWLAVAEMAVARYPGALLERKQHGFVMHFRQAPAAGPALHQAMERLLRGYEDRFTILSALMAWEMRPRGTNKATAVEALMARPPFASRVPVYIGDDVTDRDGIRAAQALGGMGWFVADMFGDAAGVRAWLAREAIS